MPNKNKWFGLAAVWLVSRFYSNASAYKSPKTISGQKHGCIVLECRNVNGQNGKLKVKSRLVNNEAMSGTFYTLMRVTSIRYKIRPDCHNHIAR